ncbi:T6SS immunity protein Tdi1 domain-containing protein [Bacillus sp. E(2018)]|uniref:T6SS immunity protein Tdi1 domain-containing protein n=1 Tax=Bacillus sp. E(2018) TaxID=2502239 RepID=UPI0010F98AE3|nr:T6SS immunity protein Tdi1 domain-containing protein [Bacillus sp. E(2018)]
MEQYIKDFKLHNKVSNEIIERYKENVPNEIIALWRKYGFGSFMQGYFKSVNPDEFKGILEHSSKRYKDAIVLFATGMGDLLIWSDGYVRLLNFRYGTVKTIMFTFEFFFSNIFDEEFRNEDLSWQPYPLAMEKYDELKYEECFGYTPLLGLGGEEKVDFLKKVKLKEHMLITNEFMGPVE